ARVPIVNIVGDQATYHRPLDPLLAADTEGWADGVSAWTRVTERAEDVTTIIFSNRRYAILIDELANVGAESGPASDELFSLRNPDMDWVQIAGGLGVEGARAETMDQFADIFTQANRQKGPFLIELMVP
ncbi:MAG: hypothetical protein GY798_29660, partial [Hyphomicrobiales bacterium]|nr:hypothetical protein [Hyphomicrobiales bacterium]